MPDSKKYLTTVQLCERWGGCSHMFLERRLGVPGFPTPIKLSDRVGAHRHWPLDQIEAYERKCAAQLAPRIAKRRRVR